MRILCNRFGGGGLCLREVCLPRAIRSRRARCVGGPTSRKAEIDAYVRRRWPSADRPAGPRGRIGKANVGVAVVHRGKLTARRRTPWPSTIWSARSITSSRAGTLVLGPDMTV